MAQIFLLASRWELFLKLNDGSLHFVEGKLKARCQVRTQESWTSGAPQHSGYDYRADLKEAHTAIVRARDEGELSLAAAQLKVCFVAPPKKAIPA